MESVIHITATGFRMAAIGIVLSLKPVEAYNLLYLTSNLTPLPSYLQLIGEMFILGLSMALIGQMLHTILSTTIGKISLQCCRCQIQE